MDSDPNRVCLHVDQIIKAHLNKSSQWKQECVSADLCSHIYSLALNQLFSLFSVGPLFILQLEEKRNSMFISFTGSFSVSNVITIHERLNYWTSILTVRPQDDEEAKIKNKVIFNQKLKTISWCGREAAGCLRPSPFVSRHPASGSGMWPPHPHPTQPARTRQLICSLC